MLAARVGDLSAIVRLSSRMILAADRPLRFYPDNVLTEEQMIRTRRLARRLAGIELLDRHREVLRRRSQRLGIQDAAGWDGLLEAVEAGDGDATGRFVALLTTKFTAFYRHPHHFDLAAAHALMAVRRNGRARLWSAAAATGQEPYSLAIALREASGREDPPVTILATDVDEQALSLGRSGDYNRIAMQSLSPGRRSAFFVEIRAGRWAPAPFLRQLVQFQALNLAASAWAVEGPFDVVFCRNVLMYLEAGHRENVLRRMAALLAPDGILCLDPAEHPGTAQSLFTEGQRGVYSRRRPTPPEFDRLSLSGG